MNSNLTGELWKERNMFEDKRSKKVVLAAHCIFNQNARISGCGYFPGAMGEAARLLTDSGVGIIQLPCAELLYLGLDRQQNRDSSMGIREALSTDDGKKACQEMLRDVIYQIKEYQKHGFEVLGVVGIDGSPSCGVSITWEHETRTEIEGAGGLIQTLQEEFSKNDLGDLKIIGIKDKEWEEGARRIKALLANTA